jgi:hypothetical protein
MFDPAILDFLRHNYMCFVYPHTIAVCLVTPHFAVGGISAKRMPSSAYHEGLRFGELIAEPLGFLAQSAAKAEVGGAGNEVAPGLFRRAQIWIAAFLRDGRGGRRLAGREGGRSDRDGESGEAQTYKRHAAEGRRGGSRKSFETG